MSIHYCKEKQVVILELLLTLHSLGKCFEYNEHSVQHLRPSSQKRGGNSIRRKFQKRAQGDNDELLVMNSTVIKEQKLNISNKSMSGRIAATETDLENLSRVLNHKVKKP